MAHTTRGTAPRSWVDRPLRVALAVLCAALFPAAAHAAVYYLGPGGSDSNNGLSPGARWATIGKANSTLRAGDVVMIQPGTYSGQVNPANSGTANARITYLGDLQNPALANVGTIMLNSSYVSVKGVRSTGTGTINYPARYDSIAYSVIEGGQVFYGAKYCMVARNRINGGISFALDQAGVLSGISNSERDTLRGNIVTMDPIGGTHGFKMRGFTQYCLIDSNRVTGWFEASSGESRGIYTYNSYFNTFRDNRWSFDARVAYGQGGPWTGISFRDSTHDFTFERDTMYLGLNSSYAVAGALSTSGAYGNVRNMTWDGCVYKTNSYFYNEDAIRNAVMRNSVFATSSNSLFFFADVVSSWLIDHCTLYTSGSQVIRIDPAITSGLTVRSSILYSRTASAPSANGGIVKYPGTTRITSDNNLYFTTSYSSTPGDRSLVWCCYTGSRPGTGAGWFNANGQDGNSRHASPTFVDSTFAGLDVHLRAGSPAIGRGAGGTDAGAYPFVPAGPDVTPPATVADLRTTMISDQVAALAWTAPGGNGTSGIATAYDLRWSLTPITAASFATATPVTPQPVPLPAGQTQGYIRLSLTPGTTYYFAIKAVDQAGNWSAMSNVLAASTTATDQSAPAAVPDLGTTP